MASLDIPEGLSVENREWLAEVRDALNTGTPEGRLGFPKGFVPTVQEVEERARMALDGIESILQGKPGFREWYSAVLLAQKECPSTESVVNAERQAPLRQQDKLGVRTRILAIGVLALKLLVVGIASMFLATGIGPNATTEFTAKASDLDSRYYWVVFGLVSAAGLVVISMPKIASPLRYRSAQSFLAFVFGLVLLWFAFFLTGYLDLTRILVGPQLASFPLVVGASLSAYVVYRSMKATRGFTTMMKKREVTVRIWQFMGATFVIAGVLAYFGARLPDLINQSSTTPRSDSMLPELLGVGVPAFVYWNMMLFLPKVILNAIETKVSDDQIDQVWKRPSKGT